MASEIKVDTVSEKTSGSGVTIDGLLIKDGGISGDVSLIGTTPTFTIGDAGAEDAALVFDGNAQDFYIALDDSADDLVIGKGSAVGTTPAVSIDENLQVIIHDNLSLLSDSSVLKFGTDGDTTLTHTDGTGLTLNSTNKICFNDATQFIQGSSGTVLSIGATDEIDLTATAVDLNGTLNVSGVATFQATPVFPDGSLALADLDIDGGTDIGAAIVDADLFIIDDGAGGTNRKTTAARLKTYIGSFNADAAQVFNESGADVDFRVESSGDANQLFVDGGNDRVTIGDQLYIGAGVATDSGFLLQVDNNGPNCIDFVGDMNDGGSGMGVIRRLAHDGAIIIFKSPNGDTGDISVSGNTVSYNAFTGSHYCEPPSKNITGITKANPAVVTSNGHGFSNGDKVLLESVVGMTEVNAKQFTIAGASTNTFQLDGIDSTSYTTYSSAGKCAVAPALGEIVSFTGTNTYTNNAYPPTDVWRQAECDRGECTQEEVDTRRPVSFYGGTGEIIYGITPTTSANDRTVLGAYLFQTPDKPDLCAAVGNYDMWIVDKGADVAVGDWLISSDVSGHAMRDDGSTYDTAYVFAMATETIDWSSVSTTIAGTSTKHKKISVLFERFVRN